MRHRPPSPIELARICRCGHYWGDHTPSGRCLQLDRRQTVLFGLPRCACHQFTDTPIVPEEGP